MRPYPKGKETADGGEKYAIYEGTVTVSGTVPAGKDDVIELRVKVTACNEGKCLLPSVIKVK